MANQVQINTAGHNISNANTEGYSRQRVHIKEFDPLYRPDLERAEVAGQIGQGTDVQAIKRVRDELLDTRIVAQTVKGAVSLLESSGKHPEQLIDQVTTPGGVTIKGLNAMEEAGFSNAVIKGLVK